MKIKASQTTLRDRLGATLDRVLHGDEFIVERRGEPLAALVSVTRIGQMRRLARRHALAVMKRQRGSLTASQAAELGHEAQQWARRQLRTGRKRG